MKKLLAMILMLGISAPVLAVEVKLLCVAGDHSWVVKFDDQAKPPTVNGHALDMQRHSSGKLTQVGNFWFDLSDDAIVVDEVDESYNRINRLTGEYKYDDKRGTCAPAKQVF